MADYTVTTDIDTFMQSADKAAMRTNMDLGTAATKDVAATGDAASGEVVKGDDTRLTDARTPTSHTHTASEVTDFDTEVANNTTVAANTSKLAGIEAGAEVNNISDVNATDLTDGGDSSLHYHSADRNRSNHTGTQTLSTISDAGTIASQSANSVNITGGSVTGITDLAIADGGTGSSTAAGARTNLDVYSTGEVDEYLGPKATAGGVRWTTGTLVGSASYDLGTADFSISGVVELSDYTPATAITLLQTHNTGNSRVQLQIQTDGDWRLIFTNSGGTASNYDLVPSGLVNGTLYHFAITADRSGNAQLYINGSTNGSAVSISASSGVDIGASNTNPFQWTQVKCDAAIFNRALTATEVADLYRNGLAGIADADRWGFPNTVSTWTNNFYNLFGTTAGTNFTASSFDLVAGSSGGVISAEEQHLFQDIKIGESVVVNITASGVSTCNFGLRNLGGLTSLTNTPALTNGTNDYILTANSDTGTAGRLYFFNVGSTSGGSVVVNSVTKLGAIAAYPMNEGIGYQLHDISSNHYDGLLSTSGFTHLVPKTEGKARVKAANASSAMYMLRAGDILPQDSIVRNVLSEDRFVDLTNSAQTLDDYRVRLEPSGSDLLIRRSDGSNHQTLGTVTAPSSLSDVDVEIQYTQVAR